MEENNNQNGLKIQSKIIVKKFIGNNLFKISTIILSFTTIGLLIFSIKSRNNLQNKLKYTLFEKQQLNEQIQALRDEKYTRDLNPPTPIPSPIPTEKLYETLPEITPFLKKEDLSTNNTYKIDCYEQNNIPQTFSWLSSLKSKLVKKEITTQLCYNSDLNQVVFFSNIETSKGGMGGPPAYKYYLKVYEISSNQINELIEGGGNLYGKCGQITNWSKTNNIYYKCGGGDGSWGGTILLRVDIQTKKSGIVETCDSFENQTDCSSYCTNNTECQSGYFCNLKANNCVKSCTTSGQCLRFVRSGCYKFTDTQRGCW